MKEKHTKMEIYGCRRWVCMHKPPCVSSPRIKEQFRSFYRPTSKAFPVCTPITQRGHMWMSSLLKEL